MQTNDTLLKICFFAFLFHWSNLTIAQDTLIAAGAEWKYYDNGNEPAGAWKTQGYNDATWATGFAQLGYGDGDETTTTSSAAYTTYFRKTFSVTDPSLYKGLNLKLIRDDGAIVYLNGTEIWRSNMAASNPGYLAFANATVNGADESTWLLKKIASGLVVGNNTITVQMHQQSIFSSDISFDFEFIADTIKKDSIIRGPYLQNGSDTSMVVRWRTAALSASLLSYGTDINNLSAPLQDSTLKFNHEILITGLQPATKYFYQIYNEEDTLCLADSSKYFKTNPVIGQVVPISIWALGDCGTANNNQRAVRDAYYNYIGNKHTDIMLLLGDNAYQDGTDREYQLAIFENMYEDMMSKTVSWSCIGNHDAHSANASNQSGPYFDIFSFPKQGEAGGVASGTEAYYSFDYGHAHFIVLNSENLTGLGTGGAMYAWCQNDIQDTNADWVICIWHHPPYTRGSHNSDFEPQLVQMRNNFLPMLEANGVDLVMCGHSHSYERSYFLNGHTGLAFSFDTAQHIVGLNGYGDGRIGSDGAYQKETAGPQAGKGAVYITAGSSGKISGGSLNHPAMYSSLNQLGSCVVEINNNQLDMKFVRENGTIDDYFTIIKNINTGISKPSNIQKKRLKLFPNPSQNLINIQTEASIQHIQLFDSKGTPILFVKGQPTSIDVSNLANGLYVLTATTLEGKHIFETFVVER